LQTCTTRGRSVVTIARHAARIAHGPVSGVQPHGRPIHEDSKVTKTTVALLALAALAAPAIAYHRQTPPIVPLTFSGDTSLPRVPAGGRRIVLAVDSGGKQVFRQDRSHNLLEQITTEGDNENPTISSSGSAIAWDADCASVGCSDPGRQIFMWVKGTPFQVTHDVTGTSVNPALSGRGTRLAFESLGDLATTPTGNSGIRQIFVWSTRGVVTQVSVGKGTSRNPGFDRGGQKLVFESSSSLAGTETNVAQIWFTNGTEPPLIVTHGATASQRPSISSDGHVIVFDSTSAIPTDGHDTGKSQIFAYDTSNQTYTQITNDPNGCSDATVSQFPGDWHVVYTCQGQGFVHYLRANVTFHVPNAAGDTSEAIAELGGHFMVVTTTANLLGSGTTAGHQVYMLNLFKLGGEPTH
jgi:Tol biopolymer transport system component